MLVEGFEEFHVEEKCPAFELTRSDMALGSARLLAAIKGVSFEPPAKPTRKITPEMFARKRRPLWPKWYYPPRQAMFSARVVRGVADDFGLSVEEVRGSARRSHVIAARCVVTRTLRDRGLSYPQIGKVLGDRDHSTIINLARRFPTYAKLNPFVEWSYANQRLFV